MKSYLCTTMRLSHLVVVHVHRGMTAKLDRLVECANDFVARHERRLSLSGKCV